MEANLSFKISWQNEEKNWIKRKKKRLKVLSVRKYRFVRAQQAEVVAIVPGCLDRLRRKDDGAREGRE